MKLLHENYVRCNICSKIFPNNEKLASHQTQCNNGNTKEVKCLSCDTNCTSFKNLKKHVKLVHEKQVKCSFCTKFFQDVEKLESHKLESHFKEVKCSLCGKTYNSMHSLNAHIRNGRSKFDCTECKKVFCGKKILRVHLRTHEQIGTHETRPKEVKCLICNASYAPKNLKNQ